VFKKLCNSGAGGEECIYLSGITVRNRGDVEVAASCKAAVVTKACRGCQKRNASPSCTINPEMFKNRRALVLHMFLRLRIIGLNESG
jgi:hypothetical protein